MAESKKPKPPWATQPLTRLTGGKKMPFKFFYVNYLDESSLEFLSMTSSYTKLYQKGLTYREITSTNKTFLFIIQELHVLPFGHRCLRQFPINCDLLGFSPTSNALRFLFPSKFLACLDLFIPRVDRPFIIQSTYDCDNCCIILFLFISGCRQ